MGVCSAGLTHTFLQGRATRIRTRRIPCRGESHRATWSSFEGGMAEFLLALINRDHPNPFYAVDFPDATPTYLKWRDEDLNFEGF